jgi:prepilin-type N-terminal cleavage/methylation domain-containing protein
MVMRRRDRGFTLVELLIALAISMVGLIGLMALQMVAIRSNASSRNFAEATALAQEKLEQLQIAPVSTLVTSTTTENNVPPSPNNTNQAVYTRVTTITTNGSQALLKVDVKWNDSYAVVGFAGKLHTVTMFDERTL